MGVGAVHRSVARWGVEFRVIAKYVIVVVVEQKIYVIYNIIVGRGYRRMRVSSR